MKTRRDIKAWNGQIMGSILRDPKTGDEEARSFFGKILGYYNANRDVTTAFSGRILAQGNILSSLITEEFNKNK